MISSLKGVRCLVLGGGGFIGTHLIKALVQVGAQVSSFGRAPRFPQAFDAVLHHSTGDLQDIAALRQALAGQEIVYHLAASTTPAKAAADPAFDLMDTVIPTLTLLHLCQDAGIRRLIFTSSGGTVYGLSQGRPFREDDPTEPISVYGLHKLMIEKHLALYRREHGIDSLVLRLSNPYGPFQNTRHGQGVVAAVIAKALAGEPVEIWGDGETVRDFIYAEDVAHGFILAAAYEGEHRTFNLGSGTGISINRLVADIETVAGHGSIQRIYKSARPVDVPVNVLDASLIKQEMGWSPAIPLQDGLKDTLRWIASQ